MAAYDVEQQSPLDWFRTAVSPEQQAQVRHEMAVQRQQDAQNAMTGAVALAVVVLVVVACVVVNRRKIAKAADTALISGLASGVRTARKARAKQRAWIARIVAQADEQPPSRK